ncbi:MAG: PPC domain-containing protein [Phycisphaerales bacterium]|nr:PPC domain-containing protein [Phycisphaerales bacterium]
MGEFAQFEPLEARRLLSGVDDRFEPNTLPRLVAQRPEGAVNSPNLGTLVGRRAIPTLALADGADVFRFVLPRAGAAGDSARIDFNNARGNLDLQLLGPGGRVLRSSLGNSNSETISFAGLNANTYFVKIIGKNGAMSPNYRLTLNAPAPLTPVNPNEDAYDGSNTREAVLARATGTNSPNLGQAMVRTLSNLKLADKIDLYAFTIPASGVVPSLVRIASVDPLDMVLFTTEGQSIRSASAYQGQTSIGFTGLVPGTYVLQITHYALDTAGVFGYSLAFEA